MRYPEFRIPVTIDDFAYRPGVVSLLRSIHYLDGILSNENPNNPTVGQKKLVPIGSILFNQPLPDNEILTADDEFSRRIARVFNLRTNMAPTEFILSQLKTANEVVDRVKNTLNIPKGKLNDEVDTPDPILLRAMRLYLPKSRNNTGQEKQVSPKVSFEMRRQLLLAIISGQLHINTAMNKPYEMLSALQAVLNDHFYSDLVIGENTDKEFISSHDMHTNEVTDIREKNSADVTIQNPNKKTSLFHFRHVLLDDGQIVEVYSSDRKKDDVDAIIKSIAKASDAEIDPTELVEDTVGKQFVINGDLKLRDAFMKKYIQTIQRQFPTARIQFDPPPARREMAQNMRGQSPSTEFKRIKIYFDGKTTAYEVMCYSLADFLNSKVRIGKMNDEGVYDGDAHSLYSIRRMAKVCAILFPESEYKYSLEERVRNAMSKKVGELSLAREIDYE